LATLIAGKKAKELSRFFNITVSSSEVESLGELERKGLLSPTTPIQKWYVILNRDFELVSRSPEGGQDEYVEKGKSEKDPLFDTALAESYKLSDIGITAFDLILTSVVEELQKAP
jgi:hypothetical protein